MSSTSAAQDQASLLQNQYKDLASQIGGQNFNVGNRWNTYTDPYSYTDMQKQLDTTEGLQEADINRNTASDIATGANATTANLASQGITSGSTLNTALAKNRNSANKTRYNAITRLKTNRAGQNVGLMNEANTNQRATTSAATGVDFGNIASLMQKYGLLQNNLGGQESNIGNFSKTNTWDDIFAGLNTGANIYKATQGGK